MKKIYLVVIASLICMGTINAQNKNKTTTVTDGGMAGYKTALGIRFGWEGGLTLKHFIKEKRALEGILAFGWNGYGFRLTGLYEVHKSFPDVEGLDWFFGGGAHIGSYGPGHYGYYYGSGGYYDKHGNWHPGVYRDRYMTFGIDGVLGLEYQFEDAPFNIALDIKPYIDFVNPGSSFYDGGL